MELFISYVINIYWYFDYIGGNENLGEVGVIIIVYDNVCVCMELGQELQLFNWKIELVIDVVFFVIIFFEDMILYFNDDMLWVLYILNVYMDGDVFFYFEIVNVIYMGDVYFSG